MIKYRKDKNNIVTLTFNMEGKKANVINHEIGKFFTPVLDYLRDEKARGILKGIIITSAKKTFLVGGELDYIYNCTDAEQLFSFTESLKKVFRELESPGVPVVAAINGKALGAGFELALACHYRIALDDPKNLMGCPEVTLGIMPSCGGVSRMLWTVGVEKAYHILTSGAYYNVREALDVGIIDEIASSKNDMIRKAKKWIRANQDKRRVWDEKGSKIPFGDANDVKVRTKIQILTADLYKRTYNTLPAPLAILNTLVEGSVVDFDTAMRIESRYFVKLMLGKEAKNLMKSFWYDNNAIREGISRPKGYGKFRPKKIGIVGAGIMGSGIATVCLENGLQVVLKDVSKTIADKGKEIIGATLDQWVFSKKITEENKNQFLKNLVTTENAADFESCDIVIEAVYENKMVKNKVMKEAEQYMDDYSIFATNTISIPLKELASASIRKSNFVGIHFFHPIAEKPLVEIIKGAETSDETIARAFDFAKLIRRTPIIVKDNWGFFVARVQNTYILEGITMLQEGYAPALIENLALQAGMSKSPLALADELSLEIVLKYERQAAELYGSKYVQHPAVKVLEKMISLERKGARAGYGFYDYKVDGTRNIWPELTTHFPVTQNEYSREEISDRFMFAQIIEAYWCLQEKIIQSDEEANLGSIYGCGFPSFKGGVIQYVEDYGKEEFVNNCKSLETRLGPRFKAPKFVKPNFSTNPIKVNN